MVNLTLTADEELVAKRGLMQTRKTTLNQLIRDYLTRLTGQMDPQRAAEEFAELARSEPGRSEEGYVFDRRAVHVREKYSQRR